MKFFDLSLLKSIDEKDYKVHKIDFETFRKAYNDFPRDLAERLVETGFGKWAPCGVNGVITTPQAIIAPVQFFFITLPTHAVKAIHVGDLVSGSYPAIGDKATYGANLLRDMRFSHSPEDHYDADEYDASLDDNEVDVTADEIEEAVKAEVEEANAAAMATLTKENAELLAEKLELENKVKELSQPKPAPKKAEPKK